MDEDAEAVDACEVAGTVDCLAETAAGLALSAAAEDDAGSGKARMTLDTKSAFDTPEAMYSLSSPFLYDI